MMEFAKLFLRSKSNDQEENQSTFPSDPTTRDLRLRLLMPTFLFAGLLGGVSLFIFLNNSASFRERLWQKTNQSKFNARTAFVSRLEDTRRLAVLINQNPMIADGVIIQSQGRILDVIQPFTEENIIDIITIYDLEGSIVAQAHDPAVFGIFDELKPWLDKLSEQGNISTTVIMINNRPILLSGVKLQSLNGPLGSTVVGYYLDEEFVQNLANTSGAQLALYMNDDLIASSSAGTDKLSLLDAQPIPIDLSEWLPEPTQFSLALLESNATDIAEFRRNLLVILAVVILTSIFSIVISLRATRSVAKSHSHLQAEVLERQRAEANLKQAKEAADAANRAKSEFLANISHELRTPLNGILGYAQILDRSQNLLETQQNGVRIIQQCGSHLLNLINDILDLSKIEARRMELYPTDFHLLTFLKDVIEICYIRAAEKGISFQFQLASEIPVAIHADEKRLRQVLINLLSNAIKFTEAGHVKLYVSVMNQDPQSLASKKGRHHQIRFLVEDTGIGMNQDQLDTIFQPFERVGTGIKQTEGTGLGLAISQTIVRMMGGSIQVQSQPGQGSTFWIDLELEEANVWLQTDSVLDKRKIIGYPGRTRTILIVDDNNYNRSVLVNLLEQIGFSMIEATDGLEGLNQALKLKPDLVITDLVMPGINGQDLTQRLRQHFPGDIMVVIISSASVFESDRQRCLEAGANDFLPKPIQFHQLLEMLQRYLSLEWIYDQPLAEDLKVTSLGNQQNQPHFDLTSDSLILPPLEILEQLFTLAKRGNLREIVRQADRLDPLFATFKERLKGFATDYQEQELMDFICQCQQEYNQQ